MAQDLRTLWYMGAKTRLFREFIDGAIGDLLAPGGTLVDLCAGTAVIARSVARQYRVIANDVQRFSATVARAHLVGDAEWQREIEYLDPESDLSHGYEDHFERLHGLLPQAFVTEDRLLPAALAELTTKSAGRCCEEYRKFVACTPPPDGDADDVAAPGEHPVFEPLATQMSELLATRRRNHRSQPYAMLTSYYMNVYFGVRQAAVIDSLRYAIDAIPPEDPHREQKRALYLAALLHACSISTSGTSHFAQPRSTQKDSELLAICKRRSIDIEFEFHRALDSIRREWGECSRQPNNLVFEMPAAELLAAGGPLADEGVGLVYFDPPYTADNYSRFYHVLEAIIAYDYPELEQRAGALTRGRYPVRAARYQSGFCRGDQVEAAFREVIESTRDLGSNLLVSYSADSGLLIKYWAAQGERQPLNRFLSMFRDYYPGVEVRQRDLMHSGQGDSNKKIRELLVLCEA